MIKTNANSGIIICSAVGDEVINFLRQFDNFYQNVLITFLHESVMTMPWSKVLTCCFTIVYTVQSH